ncbi:hypothetical protein C0J52_05071 [Blattella germanica]|nr:hypothetical protein C0J52_05071 [Blattella germanica]
MESDNYGDLSTFFSVTEWDSLTAYEKKRYFNILDNYRKMVTLGLNPKKPSFMHTKTEGEEDSIFNRNNNHFISPKHLKRKDKVKTPTARNSNVKTKEAKAAFLSKKNIKELTLQLRTNSCRRKTVKVIMSQKPKRKSRSIVSINIAFNYFLL